MRPERWREIEQKLFSVLSLSAAERQAYLGRACAEDGTTRRVIEELLAVEDEADAEGFLRRPAVPAAAAAAGTARTGETPESAPASGERIGPYRVLRQLGRGGMGRVLLAQRDDATFERQVAIKVIDGDLDGPEIHRRFLAERQILADLNHPGIAQLYEGGTLAEGRPYFVMEPVFGLPIDTFCDRHRLGLEQRLDLFQQVCGAVHYAHQNLVVHRDLKPSNILVTPQGVPKLLDFGIAKVLGPGRGSAETRLTRTAARVMTPSYASPEQVRGASITTASDVYSLGVLLYELLTGKLPYRFENASTEEIERTWRQQRPVKPSRELGRRAAGDLDNIVLKALRLEPRRRYPSADQLAEDLRRFRAGRPVAARDDTYGYRARKFLRRHVLAVAGVCGLFALVVTFALLQLDHSRQVERERRQTEQVAEFLISLFEDSGEVAPRGDTLTAAEILARGAEQIDDHLSDQPEVRATLLEAVGRAYYGLIMAEPAIERLQEALRIRRQDLGQEDHPGVASIRHHLGWAFFCGGRFQDSEELFRQALGQRRELHGEASLEVAETSLGLARILAARGDSRRAQSHVRWALEIRTRQLGAEHRETVDALNQLASLSSDLHQLDEAEALYRQAVDTLGQRPAAGVELARAWNGLGAVLLRRGDLAAAEEPIATALAMRRRLHGEDNPYFANSLAMQAALKHRQGDYPAAESLQRRYVEILHRLGGPSHPYLVEARAGLARILHHRGATSDAEALLRQVIPLGAEVFGAGHPKVALWWVWLAQLLGDTGRSTESRPLLEAAHAELLAALGPGHPDVALAEESLNGLLGEL